MTHPFRLIQDVPGVDSYQVVDSTGRQVGRVIVEGRRLVAEHYPEAREAVTVLDDCAAGHEGRLPESRRSATLLECLDLILYAEWVTR